MNRAGCLSKTGSCIAKMSAFLPPGYVLMAVTMIVMRQTCSKQNLGMTSPETTGRSSAICANVKHFFTSLGNEFFTSFGKQFFTLYGKEIFTSLGKQSFTLPDKEFFTFPVRWSAMPAGTLSTEHIRVLKPVGFSLE